MLDANDRADHELLENGDIAALLAKYEPAVTGRCAARVRGADAEDVAQNVMLRIFGEYMRGKRWNGHPFRVVVHQVTGWTIKDYFEGRTYTDLLPDDWDPGAANPTDAVVERGYLMDLFAQLSERERTIAELHFLESLGAQEIAERLDSNRNAIDQALFRIRGKLRELVSQSDG
jgi:RNA polymerase sigma factor (sigma-70 family)